MVLFAFFSFLVIWVTGTESLLLEPKERCVPTAKTYGPCHVCVCGVDGEYHCRARACQEEMKSHDNEGERKKECEPNHMYREDMLFCTCSDNGVWKSTNCRDKFLHIQPNIVTPIQKLRTNVACTSGSLVLIDCNICECGKNNLIELAACTNRYCHKGHKADACSHGDILRTNTEVCSCSDIDLYIDRLCFKVSAETIQEINRSDVESILETGRTWMRTDDINKNACVPRTVLKVDCNRCICTDTGVLACTDRHCFTPNDEALRSRPNNRFYSLPQLKSRDSPCTPGRQYRYKCNSCVCSYKGIPSCTTMICLEDIVLDKKALASPFEDSQQLGSNDEMINNNYPVLQEIEIFEQI